MGYQEEIRNQILASLQEEDPIEASRGLDRAFRDYLRAGRPRIAFQDGEAERVLRHIAYGAAADMESVGAESSSADTLSGNPRLGRFQERFRYVADMTGTAADWQKYLGEARAEYRAAHRGQDTGHIGEKTMRSSRLGAPGKSD